MRKVFLTGGSGFLGSNIFKKLLHDDVYLYNRDEDVGSLTGFDPDIILHVAGEVYDDREMVDSNIILTSKLLNEALKLKTLKSFVYVGSSSEYGRKDHPIKEDELLEPTNLYEATKGAASLLCQAYAKQFNLPVMVARPFSLYGEGESDFRFIPKAIKYAKARKEFTLAPGVHDWIYVDDFIKGIMMLAEKPIPGEIVNFGTGTQTTNEDVLDLVERYVGRKTIRKTIDRMYDYDSTSWVADISKANRLGWKPSYTLKQGLKLTVESYL